MVWTNGDVKNELSARDLSLDGLKNRPVAELRTLYQDLLHTTPPNHASAAFLCGNIAWTLQAMQQKQDPDRLRIALQRRATGKQSRPGATCQSGTRLVREWQGETYEVSVLEKGYQWQGRHYRSLSRIAREITGARWSGPRFFGLRCNTGE